MSVTIHKVKARRIKSGMYLDLASDNYADDRSPEEFNEGLNFLDTEFQYVEEVSWDGYNVVIECSEITFFCPPFHTLRVAEIKDD
jgi:hypothetical protein